MAPRADEFVDNDVENKDKSEVGMLETVQHWHVMTQEQSLRSLMVQSGRNGLTEAEAEKRFQQYGPNELTEKKKRTIWERIWDQINNVLVFILLVVAAVSFAKGLTSKKQDDALTNFIEVGLIVGVIILNTWIGIKQEGSAEKAANALKAMLSSDAKVIRDGKKKSVPAREIVPGDIVVVSLGDRVPADLRMIEVSNLACQEAALTGESLPVEKTTQAFEAENPQHVPLGDRKNMSFSATLVSQGEGLGVVVATGDNTEIGNINALVNKVENKKTAVLEQIDMVSRFIAGFVMITALVTFLVGFLQTGLDPLSAVSVALVCAVAMIPEGLAAIVTLAYAYAVSQMAKENAIVRILPAVETLGSVTVICSDKTGTLTKNEMSLVAFITSNAKYKFNTDCTDRGNFNFIREDTFMAVHAQEKKNVDTFVNDVENNTALSSDSTPVPNGVSPSAEFLRSGLAGGVLCSNSVLGKNGTREGEVGNPTELAIMRAAYFSGVDMDGMREMSPEVGVLPFSSEYKFMATVHPANEIVDGPGLDNSLVVHVKGAPDRLIPLCGHQAKAGSVAQDDLEAIDTEYWLRQAAIMSSHGLRVLALCRGVVGKDDVQPGQQLKAEFVKGRDPWLTIVGLCAIMDPPRPECVDAIKEAHGAGVRVVMITGDHKDTALAIGDMLGLVDEKYSDAITGPEMDSFSEDELRRAVMRVNVFARSSPENKIQIVKALQAEKQVCSMTGDGVNDAPALKAADMGVAMGKEGTDVARESAEMILADDNFATIIAAVRQGRVVWDNLRKILFVNTPINNAQGMSVLFGMIFGLEEAPLTPIQVLYCNLICAVTLGFVLAVEPAEEGIMSNPPRRVGKRLIGRYLFLRIVIGTVVLVSTTVLSVFWARDQGYDLDAQRSQASNNLTFGAISVCLSARFSYMSSFHPRLFRGNIYAWYAVFLTAALQLCITYIPGLNTVVFGMGPQDAKQWIIVLSGMAIVFVVMEIEKAVRRALKSSGANTDDVVTAAEAY